MREKKSMILRKNLKQSKRKKIVKYFKKISVLVFLFSLMHGTDALFLWADLPEGATPASSGVLGLLQSGGIANLMPFLLMFGVMYFFVFRPQQQKLKQQQTMLGSLKVGDEVLTHSGLLGRLTGITDQVVTLELADQVRVKMMKTQVARKGSFKDFQEKSSG